MLVSAMQNACIGGYAQSETPTQTILRSVTGRMPDGIIGITFTPYTAQMEEHDCIAFL